MRKIPDPIAEFLSGKHIAVAGVSREGRHVGNSIYRRLRDSGYEVYPINPNAGEVEGVQCYADLAAVPEQVDGLVVATHPDVSIELVRQCSKNGVGRVWFHRSFGDGSVSADAVRECESAGLQCIVGGCPLMFCEPVDFGHKCMRWWLQRKGRVPR
jgi:predicted CoA-binding protein